LGKNKILKEFFAGTELDALRIEVSRSAIMPSDEYVALVSCLPIDFCCKSVIKVYCFYWNIMNRVVIVIALLVLCRTSVIMTL
jgi:hypothetical protein